MSEHGKNIETVGRVFEIFQTGDHDELPALIDPDVQVTVLDTPELSRPRGFDGVKGMIDAFARTARLFESTRVELRLAVAVDDRTVLAEAQFTARARREMESISQPLWFVFRFGGGKVVSVEEFDDEQSALAVAGAPAHSTSSV